MLIAMLVPMTSVALTGCNGKNEVSKATPDQATALITTQQVTTQAQTEPTVAQKLHKHQKLITRKHTKHIKLYFNKMPLKSERMIIRTKQMSQSKLFLRI